MTGVHYLLLALGLSVVLSIALWLGQRKPKTFMSSIDGFRREMDALARDGSGEPPPKPTTENRARNGRLVPIVPAPRRGDLARKLRAARKQGAHQPSSTDRHPARYPDEES